ncbi:Arylsulfatase B [Seminavis robusta]|uniref:Arylsulfatase B n=1 Tax=Seminavis robusta TaxID=568900 RepID=A0A9N8DDU6_9STRA|nr:Arylsulfatase B [Seminavis robusta]|eukprot:Sro96_g049710.1 Arylsulfatase B (569) ;mRNA; r:106802-108508
MWVPQVLKIFSLVLVLVFAEVVSCVPNLNEVRNDGEPKTTKKTSSTNDGPPHIILMLADDMGWYNAPWNGNAEIQERMPFIHSLSQTGVILDRHYSYKYCSPARSSLLSGRFPLHVTQNNKNNLITNPGGADLRMTLLPQQIKHASNSSYKTACIGKWHVGGRSTANLPTSRGFDHHFGFLKGGQDHFTQINTDTHNMPFVDLWSQQAPAFGRNGTYSTYLYAMDAVNLIQQHSPKTKPLFLYLAWQAMHGPLEAPPEYETPVDNDSPHRARSRMNAMAAILDEGVQNVTRALRESGLYENAILIFSSDNGGWIQAEYGGNNYPLRGGKVTDFEGGVRAAAFVTGGYVERHAPHLVGTRSNLLVHLVDWYATLVGLAGSGQNNETRTRPIEDENDDVPPVDSRDFWHALITPNNTNVTAVRHEIPLSYCTPEAECDFPGGTGDHALIDWPWKVVNGTQGGLGVWQGTQFPNATKRIPMPGPDAGCPNGCLFDIEKDPTEHVNVKDQYPIVFRRLWDRLLEVGQGVYQTNYDGGAKTCLPVSTAYKRDKGYLAPRCTVDDDAEMAAEAQ